MKIRTNIVYIQFVYILLCVVWRTIREYFTTHKDVIIYGEGLQILGISPGGHLNRKGSFSCHTCKNGNEINSRQALDRHSNVRTKDLKIGEHNRIDIMIISRTVQTNKHDWGGCRVHNPPPPPSPQHTHTTTTIITPRERGISICRGENLILMHLDLILLNMKQSE